jgi:hypothetical protein
MHRIVSTPARTLLLAALLLATWWLAPPPPAAAQMREAGSGIEVGTGRQQQLETAMDEARYHLGPFRVAPWIGLRDVSYVRGETGSGDGQSDLTATAGAGLRAYLPFRDHAILAVQAMPEYSWWQEQSDRNAVIGHYGVGFFGFFNRLQTELTARSVEEVGFLSSDLLVREPIRGDELAASVQLRVGGALALFGSASSSRVRVEETDGSPAPGADLLLDRDLRVFRVGARYLLRGDRGHLGVGMLDEQAEFVQSGARRSNEGRSWYGEAALRGNNLDVVLTYDRHQLEPSADSAFPGYDAPGGRAIVSLHPGHRLRYTAYAFRELRYSAADIDRYFEEERVGGAISTGFGPGSLAVFYEAGENAFFGSSAAIEDVTAYGASAGYRFGRYLALRVGSRTTRFELASGVERELREVQGSLALTLGSPPGDW